MLPSFSPSLISLMVSVDAKHHVYLLTHPYTLPSFSPSLISLMVSVDAKHHVYLLTHPYTLPSFSPSLISLMVSVDAKHHVYLLTSGISRAPTLQTDKAPTINCAVDIYNKLCCRHLQ